MVRVRAKGWGLGLGSVLWLGSVLGLGLVSGLGHRPVSWPFVCLLGVKWHFQHK